MTANGAHNDQRTGPLFYHPYVCLETSLCCLVNGFRASDIVFELYRCSNNVINRTACSRKCMSYDKGLVKTKYEGCTRKSTYLFYNIKRFLLLLNFLSDEL